MDANQNGTEDFLLVDSHFRSYVIDNGWGNEVTLRIFGVSVVSPIEYNFCAFLFSSSHQFYDSFFELLVADWTQINSFLVSSSNFERLSLRNQLFNPVAGFSNKYCSSKSHASLS